MKRTLIVTLLIFVHSAALVSLLYNIPNQVLLISTGGVSGHTSGALVFGGARTAAASSDTSSTFLISLATLIVTSITAFSSTLLAWRGERRQAKESALKIEQLEMQLAEARTKIPDALLHPHGAA